MEAEIGLGADIIMAFDECTEFPAEPERVRASMEMTLRWAERSKAYFEAHQEEVPWGSRRQSSGASLQSPVSSEAVVSRREDSGSSFEFRVSDPHRNTGDLKPETRNLEMAEGELRSPGQTGASAPTWAGASPAAGATQALFGIVQGGMDLGLRRESALRTVEIGFPGYAIGGLSVGEPREVTREVVEGTVAHLPADRPRYLMGVGTPEEIALYAGLGIACCQRGRRGMGSCSRRRGRFRSSRRGMRATAGRSIRHADAGSAGAIRGHICDTCMPLTKCWHRC
jgi:queuine tRNA-ribosyltransferase